MAASFWERASRFGGLGIVSFMPAARHSACCSGAVVAPRMCMATAPGRAAASLARIALTVSHPESPLPGSAKLMIATSKVAVSIFLSASSEFFAASTVCLSLARSALREMRLPAASSTTMILSGPSRRRMTTVGAGLGSAPPETGFGPRSARPPAVDPRGFEKSGEDAPRSSILFCAWTETTHCEILATSASRVMGLCTTSVIPASLQRC
mmetsp:Transcript_54535/g.129530  ORF Transcript_54535/g.129530 Transcript_54535/m.129530 type:complete len:210 (+) Transcript_54535:458-1087(+)